MDSIQINDQAACKGIKAKKNTRYMKYFAVVLLLVAVVGVAKVQYDTSFQDLSQQIQETQELVLRQLGCPYWRRQREIQAAQQRQQEAARQEAARQEAARQEAARQEAARQEAARQEAARQQSNTNNQQSNNNNQQSNNNNQQTSSQDPQDFKDRILRETNIRRCMHGAPPLVWNDPLYQNTFETFKSATRLQHSNCYSLTSAQGGPAGENLYMASYAANPESAVTAWYNEVNYCQSWPGCEQKSGTVGHFTALVWKGVTVMACSRSQLKPGLIACRYGNGPGSRLTGNTPNMRGWYTRQVFAATKSYEQCAAQF